MRYDDPELRRRLAGEYVLGTMPSRTRRRFARLIRDDPALAALVAAWEARLAPLDATTPPIAPPARVWRAIERRIAVELPTAVPALGRRWVRSLALWQGIAAGAAAICVALALYLVLLPPAPTPAVVAVLADDRGDPSWVAITGPRLGEVQVTALRDVPLAADQSLELWTLSGGAPRPLGLVPQGRGRSLPVAAAKLPAPGGTLAISSEPAGGSPTGLPTGPVLYRGKMLARP